MKTKPFYYPICFNGTNYIAEEINNDFLLFEYYGEENIFNCTSNDLYYLLNSPDSEGEYKLINNIELIETIQNMIK